jgi:hypothetical protein
MASPPAYPVNISSYFQYSLLTTCGIRSEAEKCQQARLDITDEWTKKEALRIEKDVVDQMIFKAATNACMYIYL